MIVLSTETANATGSVPIRENKAQSVQRDGNARVSRVAVLDGSSVVSSNGFKIGDLTVIVAAKITEEKADALWELYTTETKFVLACVSGCFYGAIRRLRVDRGDLRLVFLVEEDDSAA